MSRISTGLSLSTATTPQVGLPAPTVAHLGRAIDEGRLLIVVDDYTGPILAAAAIFEFSPSGWRTYVGELSGTCVLKELGGYGPLNLQRVLLAARVLGHVALNSDLAPEASSTLVTVVKADNMKSLTNVVAAGFQPLDVKPDWMVYEEHAWYGSPVGSEWRYFVADGNTAVQAVADLDSLGLLDGQAKLTRTDKLSGAHQILHVRSLLLDLSTAKADLKSIQAGTRSAGLSPPPSDLQR